MSVQCHVCPFCAGHRRFMDINCFLLHILKSRPPLPVLSHLFPLLCNSLLDPPYIIKILISFPLPHPLSHQHLHPILLFFFHPSVHPCLMPEEGMTDPLSHRTADSRRAQDVVWTHLKKNKKTKATQSCSCGWTLKRTTSAGRSNFRNRMRTHTRAHLETYSVNARNTNLSDVHHADHHFVHLCNAVCYSVVETLTNVIWIP